jgi:hypothetical protein
VVGVTVMPLVDWADATLVPVTSASSTVANPPKFKNLPRELKLSPLGVKGLLYLRDFGTARSRP